MMSIQESHVWLSMHHQAMCSVVAPLILASLSDEFSAVNQTLLHTKSVLAIVLLLPDLHRRSCRGNFVFRILFRN